MNLIRNIKFTPAYDRRNPDPNKNYGIHGVNIIFSVKGDEGVVTFVLFTNWQLPSIDKEKGIDILCKIDHPVPADLGFHSKKKQYAQHNCSGECEYLDGENCYYDGTSLGAKNVFDILKEKGDEGVFKYLEDKYKTYYNIE